MAQDAHAYSEPKAATRLQNENQEPSPYGNARSTIFLGILCLIATLVCLYLARDIVLPIVLAIVLQLFLQPFVRRLQHWHVPKPLGALLAVILLLGVFVGLGTLLTTPAANWAATMSSHWSGVEQKFAFLRRPAEQMQHTLDQMGIQIGSPGQLFSHPVGMVTAVFSGTGSVAGHLFETVLMLFYLLVFSETILRRLVEVLPTLSDKRKALEISLQVERDISIYLLVVTIINSVVGCATAAVMWLCGIPGSVLWGVIAFCLNFVPILGPFCGVLLFLAVGLISKGVVWSALLPTALYFGVHVLEGEFITPMLLARRFTLNPIAIILSLIFWNWMWGIPGAILAVPMLAIIKIISDRLQPLHAFGHMLEG